MKALSIRQPWAWLIVHGYKDIENRTWSTAHRGPLLVHAGRQVDPDIDAIRRRLAGRGIDVPEDLPLGGIVGRMAITGCVTEHDSPWFEGPYGFLVEDPEPLPFLPWRGQLGLFEVDYTGL